MKFSYKFSSLLGSVYGGGDLLFSPGEVIFISRRKDIMDYFFYRWKHCHLASGQQDINVRLEESQVITN